MIRHAKETGFTAVELLITLFIAAVFLFAGYQLYVQVTRDASDADKTAKVSNLVQERLRKQLTSVSGQYPNGCVAASASTTNENQSVTGIGNVALVIVTRCPIAAGSGSATDLFQVTVTGTYNERGQTRTVQHSSYSN